MAPSAATITAVESFIQMAEAFLPASVKPYVADLLVDGPEGLAAYAAIKAGLAAVSAKTCVGYVVALGKCPPDSAFYTVAQLIDSGIAQVEAAKSPAPVVPAA